MEIKVKVDNHKIYMENKPFLASGDVGSDEILFTFVSSYWDGYEKTAVFYHNENELHYAKLVGDKCTIPFSAINHEGTMYFGLFGIKGEKRIVSEVIPYWIAKGAGIEDNPPVDTFLKIIQLLSDNNNKVTECMADHTALREENAALETRLNNKVNTAVDAVNQSLETAKTEMREENATFREEMKGEHDSVIARADRVITKYEEMVNIQPLSNETIDSIVAGTYVEV